MTDLRDEIRSLVEAASEDHFYGAWKGGAKGAGGHPGGTSKPGLEDALKTASASPNPAEWDPNSHAAAVALEKQFGDAGVPYTGEPNSLGRHSRQTPNARYDTFVYRGPENRRPVGFVNLRTGDDGSKKVMGVSIWKAYRGKGYGAAMYDMIQDTTDVNLYEYVGQSKEFTTAGKAFATKWLQHRIEMEAAS